MSAMNALYTAIQEELERGETPFDIAHRLDIPVSWVFEVSENLDEEYNPYATVNS